MIGELLTTIEDIDLCQLKFDVNNKIHCFIDHRIKIVTSSDATLKPRETKLIPTNLINSKRIKLNKFNTSLKSAGKIPVKFLSEVRGDIKFKERLFVEILNYNNFSVKIFSNTPIAYLFLQPKIQIKK